MSWYMIGKKWENLFGKIPVTDRTTILCIRLAFGGLFLFFGLLAFSSLLFPMGADQGSFATGAEILLNGGSPYLDFWELKGPACQLTYALALFVFGHNMWGIRVLDLFFLGVTAVFIWRFLYRKGSLLVANTGALIYCFTYLRLGFWGTAQPDGWAGMLILIAFLLLADSSRPGFIRLFMAGALIGLAAQYKFLYAGALFVLLLYQLEVYSGLGPKRLWGAVVLFSGFAFMVGLFLAWLTAHQALAEFVDISFRFNRVVHMAKQSETILPWLKINMDLNRLWYAGIGQFLVLIPFGFVAFFYYQRHNPVMINSLSLLWIATIVIVMIQGRYGRYHLIPSHGPIAVFAALGISALLNLFQGGTKNDGFKRAGQRIVAVVALVLVLLMASPSAKYIYRAAFRVSNFITPQAYYQYYGCYGCWGFCLAANIQVADYIRKRSDPEDKLLIWGFDPLIYYLSDRKPASRFIFNYPLDGSKNTPYYRSYRREYIQDLIRNKPLYVVVDDNDANQYRRQDSKKSFETFTALRSYVNKHYIRTAVIENYDIYRRRDRPN